MVAFGRILASAMALAVPVIAQTTPAQVVTNIDLITQKSQALQAPAQSINLINGPLILIGQGPFPQIITGFADIVSTATTALSQIRGMPPVPAGDESNAIFDAFREVRHVLPLGVAMLLTYSLQFVRVHQALLNILIGKAGLFSTVPFIGQPVAAVLRQVESVVDTIAFALIDTVQSRAADLQAQTQSLDGTLTTTINAYEGLSLRRKTRSLRIARQAAVAAA
ncbi:UVI-1h [Didymella exigua CBS 183.55]|uniref:UVI-1h n=1 Tax=Didymella exigua CBS 183.55 TaxID=1150837 RepID=A0A6A5S5F2_9PLEO|nr:UVI-1h [Didymella exigua CBS 183.55]KAF1933716.1 UVI-1h [Didymella exigua CBS 183.55]